MDAAGSRGPLVSAIVVAHARRATLRACLESALAQSERRFELLVVLNDAARDVREAVADLAASDDRIVVLGFSGTASEARNLALAKARSPVVYFVDDDAWLPPHAFAHALAELEKDEAIGILGGPNLTPPDDPWFAQVTGALLGSLFGAGVARFRYRPMPAGEAMERHLILCNMVARRTIFSGPVRFPGAFGGEEHVLLGHAVERGIRLRYSPRLWVYHRRRPTLRGFLSQLTRYGRGRANAVVGAPGTAHPAYFLPLALALYLVLLPWVAAASPWSFAPLVVYLLLAVGSALALATTHRRASFFVPLLLLFPASHLAYAVGLAGRLFVLAFHRRERGHISHPSEARGPIDPR